MSVAVRNTVNESLDIAVPTHEDGSFYRFEMICDGGWTRFYTDSLSELLGYLIPGYTSMTEQQKLEARILNAADYQVRLQAQINAFYVSDPAPTDEEWAILSGPRHVQPAVDVWTCNHPLVIVDAFYAPYSDAPAPVSGDGDVANPNNIWWLRPATGEFEYLQSLHDASVIELHMLKDEAI